MKGLIVACACLVLGACANDYAQFYTPVPSGSVAVMPFSGQPALIQSTGNQMNDIAAMWARGFGPVGYASFNGPMRSIAGALAQGKKVGAQYVVVSEQYSRTVSGVIPMTTFSPQTTYTSGTVNVYGSGGFATGDYNGTSTTYNSQTSYIPYSIARYNQQAIFFGPLAREGVGIAVKEISPTDAQRLGTQKGVIVLSVRRGSPAFDADILPGDVLTEVAGHPVYDRGGALAQFQAIYGSDAVMRLLRNGSIIEKTVRVPAGGLWD